MKILIVPLPEFGHVAPAISLARKLKRAGLLPSLFTHTRFREELERFQVEHISFSTAASEMPHDDGTMAWLRLVGNHAGASVADVFEGELAQLQIENWDLILLDEEIVRRDRNGLLDRIGRSRVALFLTALPNRRTHTNAPVPQLVLCPECVELPEHVLRFPNVFYVDPCLPASQSTEDRQIDGRVVVSFGTQDKRYRHIQSLAAMICSTAVSRNDLDWYVPQSVASWGKLVPAPAHIHVSPVYEINALCPTASLLITHGGLGVTKSALYNGVPQVILPQLFDQHLNAKRCTYHGVAVSLDHTTAAIKSFSAAVDASLKMRDRGSLIEIKEKLHMIEQREPSVQLISALLP
jgi:UDP:flavonoid glycosyltransferase YjiC (YdhE family)